MTPSPRFTKPGYALGVPPSEPNWGAVFEDLDLDGRLDLLVAQNYIKWPIHALFPLPGRTYLQRDETFHHAPALGLENPHFGQALLIADRHGDGRPDVLWLNMDGPARAFLNRSAAHYLTVSATDDIAAPGTRVHVETAAGKSYAREVIASTGMLTDQATDLVFGLSATNAVDRVVITYPDGVTETIESPDINTKIAIRAH